MSFSFGRTTTATPAASTGFSFGSTPPAGSASTSGFNFGAAPATNTATSAPAAGGFSFGGGTPATSAAPSAFSFGNTTGAPTGTGGMTGNTGSLFGGTSATPSATATTGGTGGFSFGGAAPTGTGGSLFGGSSTAAPAAGGNLFGSTTGTAPAGGSFFGSTAPTRAAGTGSFGSSFGAFGAPSAAAQPQSGQGITLETVVDTLSADIKKNITEFHAFLKEEEQSDAFLKTVSPRKLEDLKGNMEQLEKDVLAHRNVQDRQATAVHHVRKDVKHLIHQVDTASLTMRSLDGSSVSNYYNIMRRVEMPSPYYWELLDHFEAKMEIIKAQIENVEAEFKPLYERGGGSSQNMANATPAMLQHILVSQNAALMQVAAHVAEVHERAEEMRQLFLKKMREDLEKHGEKNPAAFQNPFDKRKKNAQADADKRQAIDKIRFRTNVAPMIVSAPAAAAGTVATTTPSTGFGFGTTPATTTPAAPFGTTTSTPGLFGSGSTVSTANTSTTSTGGGFNFGNTAAPKQVSFNLSTPAPATITSTTGLSGFTAPTVNTDGGFGSITSSFLSGGADKKSTGSKRASGRAQKKGR